MKFIDLKIKYKNNGIIDVRNVVNFFGHIDRRRLYEWQKKGYIRKITNNWYVFSDIEIGDIMLRMIANRIYAPSYIGLESALVYYELIPEAAFQITSITTRKTKLFKTSIAQFKYRTLDKRLFFGYDLIKNGNYSFFISNPEKTILDYLYLNPYLREIPDFSELRINRRQLQTVLNISKLKKYLNIFKHRNFNNFFRQEIPMLRRGFGGLRAIPQGVTAEEMRTSEHCRSVIGALAHMNKLESASEPNLSYRRLTKSLELFLRSLNVKF